MAAAPDKSLVVIFGEDKKKGNIINISATLEGSVIKKVDNVKYLGIRFDNNFSISKQIKHLEGKMNYAFKTLQGIINFSTRKNTLNIAQGKCLGAFNHGMDTQPPLSLKEYSTLQKLMNNNNKLITGLHYNQISKPISQSELLKICGQRSFFNSHRMAALLRLNKILISQTPKSLYYFITKCIVYTEGSRFLEQFPIRNNAKENNKFRKLFAGNFCTLMRGIRKLERIPFMNEPKLSANVSFIPQFDQIYPTCFKQFFNELPWDIRILLGTFEFNTTIRGHFDSLCQHTIQSWKGRNKCKNCELPKIVPIPELNSNSYRLIRHNTEKCLANFDRDSGIKNTLHTNFGVYEFFMDALDDYHVLKIFNKGNKRDFIKEWIKIKPESILELRYWTEIFDCFNEI